MKPKLLCWLNWLVARTLVHAGLPDAWRLRIEGRVQEGTFTSEAISELDRTKSPQRIEICHVAARRTGSGLSSWFPIRSAERWCACMRQGFYGCCLFAGGLTGLHVWLANDADWQWRGGWALLLAIVGGLLAGVGLPWLWRTALWECYLGVDQSGAFWRGARQGLTTALVVAATVFWCSNHSLDALGLALLVLTAVCGIYGLRSAHQEHRRLVQEIAVPERPASPSNRAPVHVDTRASDSWLRERLREITCWRSPLLMAVAVALVVVNLPRNAGDWISPDASWSSVLGYAHVQGWQFGRDLIFNYGPLGFLLGVTYSPHSAGLRLLSDPALALITALGVCLVAWRIEIQWRLLLIVSFLLSPALITVGYPHPAADLLLYVGLLMWGLLCLTESRWRAGLSVLSFSGMAAFAALGKFSFVIVAGFSVILIAGGLLWQRRRRLAALLGFAFGGSLVVGWKAAGQAGCNAWLFLRQGFEISRAYEQTMGLACAPGILLAAMTATALTLGAVLLQTLSGFHADDRTQKALRCFLLLWFAGLLFVVWKHGIVRADGYHLELLFGFLPVLGFTVQALPFGAAPTRRLARAGAIAGCLISLVSLNWVLPGLLERSIAFAPAQLVENADHLLHPTRYWQRMNEHHQPDPDFAGTRRAIGPASVDVFGYYQLYALMNGLNYHPRPVFQSYAAGNARLMRANEAFGLSGSAPKKVLFCLAPPDNKLPPLEDALTFRDLLINYRLEAEPGSFLLLNAYVSEAPKLELLHSGSVAFGEAIPLNELSAHNLWLEIQVSPSLVGQIRSFFYKPPLIELAVALPNRPTARFAAPPPMLAAGFLACPLLLDNSDVANLYRNKSVQRPIACSIEANRPSQRFWKPRINYRLYRIANRLGAGGG